MSDHENYYTSDTDNEENTNEENIPIPTTLYPLKYSWVMYDHTKSDSNTYEASTRKICEFNSVINFWRVFNNYPVPSKLFNNGIHRSIMKCSDGDKEISSISVFKKGILPKWEDPVNKNGAEFSKRKFSKTEALKELDSNWLDILMACVGCIVDQSVTGVRVVDSSASRTNDYNGNTEFKVLYRIEMWFEDLNRKEVIEEQFKKILSIDDPKAIHYKLHS